MRFQAEETRFLRSERGGVEHHGADVSEWHLCYLALLKIMDRFRPCFAPAQVYGL